MTRVTARSFVDALSTMVSLTTAQHSLLERIAEHEAPVTIPGPVTETELHVSSVWETLDILMGMGFTSCEQLLAQGRGHPTLGYPVTIPTDSALSALMLSQMTSAILDVSRKTNDDLGAITRLIGHKWTDHALEATGISDRLRFAHLPEGFALPNRMGEIHMSLFALGFVISPLHGHPTLFMMTVRPFMHPKDPDPLALELRQDPVERILERIAVGHVGWTYIPDVKQPMRVVVTLGERITKAIRETSMPVRFFGDAAEAVGAEGLEILASSLPTALDVLLRVLADSRPIPAPTLGVSTFLLDRKSVGRNIPLRPDLQLDALPPFVGGRFTTVNIQICTLVIDTSLDPVAVGKTTRRTGCGAFVSFVRVVRSHDDNEGVQDINCSARPQAEGTLQDLIEGFVRRGGVHHTEVHHQVGSLHTGDEAMAIVVTAEHRNQVFATCSNLADEVKVHLSIWKKQFRPDGSREWSELWRASPHFRFHFCIRLGL